MRNTAISETSDTQLVAEVRAGDRAAFGHLVRRHAPIAKRMAVLWGAGAEADDVVQDAFVKAYAALPRFRAGGEFRAWLLTIVRNETRNLFRSRGRRAAREELALALDDVAFDPEAMALSAVRRDELLEQVRRLTPDLREVVACRYLLELSEAETAAALQIPAGTVKSRLHRALTVLRKEVADV
ncbi:MAG TPA: sigma-70 family RNA polymerase sigma factor [Propionibacteriaceae bacterium]|nr:sigma-70 family RNA polymerase sigma factor [Propionibacteriaceae bacterium]